MPRGYPTRRIDKAARGLPVGTPSNYPLYTTNRSLPQASQKILCKTRVGTLENPPALRTPLTVFRGEEFPADPQKKQVPDFLVEHCRCDKKGRLSSRIVIRRIVIGQWG